MDRFAVMSAFVRVVETGSFTKAAESMGVSRATVTVAIQQLEDHLGARLLHRTTRRVSLTEDGQLYFERAGEVLGKLDASDQLFRDKQSGINGRLSLDVPTRIARRILLPALPDLLAQHPGLEIRLGASDRVTNLVEAGIDAVVRVGPLRDSSHIVRPLGHLAQINCASPRYLARHGHPGSLDDLDRHQVVTYSSTLQGQGSWDYVVDGEERSRSMKSVVTVDNAETYIAACLAGLGLIQVPAYDVAHYLESGALVAVLPHSLAAPLPISLLYPSRRQLPRRLAIFASWAAALFERNGMLQGT